MMVSHHPPQSWPVIGNRKLSKTKCFVYSSCGNRMSKWYNGVKSVQPNISDKLENHNIHIRKVIRISIKDCKRLSLTLVQTSREGTKKMKVKYDCISAWSLTPFETTFTSQVNFISFYFSINFFDCGVGMERLYPCKAKTDHSMAKQLSNPMLLPAIHWALNLKEGAKGNVLSDFYYK